MVSVYNEHFFRNLENYQLEWTITADGVEKLSGVVQTLQIPAQMHRNIQLGYDGKDILPLEGEIILTLKYTLKSDEQLLEKGHCIAYNQIVISAYNAENEFSKAVEKVDGVLTIAADTRTVRGEDFEVKFNGRGEMMSYKVAGKELLSKPIVPQFYRALTENDYGVRKNGKNTPYYHSWKMFRNPERYMNIFLMEEKDGVVEVHTRYTYGEIGMSVVVNYTIDAAGRVVIKQNLRPGGHKLDIRGMLRFGVGFAMPDSFGTIEFYGAGAHESYADRKSGAPIGIYSQSVAEQFCTTYSRPQESGAHCDLRYWTIKDKDGVGVKVLSNILFSATAIPYPIEQIDVLSENYRKYPQLLEADGNTYVNIDMAQSGLVCRNSWGAIPLEQYQIKYQPQQFEFVLIPIK